MKEEVVKICFYCKKLIKEGKCPKCGSTERFIKVYCIKRRINSKWNIFNPKYHYEVIDSKYKFVEKQLNDVL